jgi:hypothetical protein
LYASTRKDGHALGGGKALQQFSRNNHVGIVAPFERSNNDD